MSVKSPLLSEHSQEARRVRLARERMHAGQEPDPDTVRPLILASWRRSRSAGVDPHWGLQSRTVTGPSAGTSKVDASTDRRLVDAATPTLALLRDALSDHVFGLMLTDRERRTAKCAGLSWAFHTLCPPN